MESIARLAGQLREFPGRVWVAVGDLVEEEGRTATARMRSQFVPYPNASGEQLNIRSSRMRNAIGSKVERSIGAVRLEAGILSDDQHLQRISLTNEEGDPNIRPVHAAKLAYPVGAALRADGTRRYATVREAAKDYITFSLPKVVIGKPRGGGKSEVLFIRADSTHNPGRPFIFPRLAEIRSALEARLPDVVAGAL